MTTLWDEFASFDNFLLAWQRTVNCSSRMVSDDLGVEAFAYNLNENLYELVRLVQDEEFPYEPLADHKVYIPKPSSTLRTMSLLTVQDVIIYQAMVNVIADHSHEYLVTHENQNVLGNLYAGPGKRWMLKPWKIQYTRFVNRIIKIYDSGKKWIASTDIVAFYDTIDHERLIGVIRRYCPNDEKLFDLFRKCISKWAAHSNEISMSRGIPQGSNASDYLANLYLYEIDREMIVQGYQYVRYVDDVRILGSDKATVQKGLILFDLELKRAGLVAQVTKTSIHQIEDIEKEINRLKFTITDIDGTGEYILVTSPTLPKSEQAESIGGFLAETTTSYVQEQSDDGLIQPTGIQEEDWDEGGTENFTTIEKGSPEKLQEQLVEKFLENYELLDDPDSGKQAESSLTFCLYRLGPCEEIREQALALLAKIPWRSEAITACLARFKQDEIVIQGLRKFILEHEVYSWHRANALWALSQITDPLALEDICRAWMAEEELHWYARTIAARILINVPTQHAYFMECLKREQEKVNQDGEETAILRQELAKGAFARIRSPKKQLALFKLIAKDPSPLVKRLSLYLLQQPRCRIGWNDLAPYHEEMRQFSEIIKALGISSDISRQCFLSKTLTSMYRIKLDISDLRNIYGVHYDECVQALRKSTVEYHKSPDEYIHHFHQFIHLTLIAFYESVLPRETGLYEGYARLTDRKVLTDLLPVGINVWKDLGKLRIRVDHPVEKRTQAHSRKISVRDLELFFKRIQPAIHELIDVWIEKVQSQNVVEQALENTR